jgi:thioredoxin reductase (NADPH)
MPGRPLIAIVGSDDDLADVLTKRFGSDYEIVASAGPAPGRAALQAAADSGTSVALAIASSWAGGIEHLMGVRDLHPGAKRALVIRVGDVGAQADIRRALTLNHIDFFFGVPWASPEEEVYPVVGEALRLWAREHQPRYDKATILDRDEAGRGSQIRSTLERNSVWTTLHSVDSAAGRALVEQHELSTDRLPVVVLWDGRVLIDPRDDEIAEGMGARTRPDGSVLDVVVVGCGPAGLAAAAYAASEGLRVLGIESEAVGGQAATTSRIRNYLGFRWGISGGEFGERASRHAEDLGADFIVMRKAVGVRADGDQRVITLDNGDEVSASAVVLAGGVAYRRLGVPEVDRLTGFGVLYGAGASEARSMSGLQVYVIGGGNSAGQVATSLAGAGAHVTMLIRRDSLRSSMTDYLVQEVEATGGVRIRPHTEVVGAGSVRQLEHLVLRDTETGAEESVKADALFIYIGARPYTQWLEGSVALDDKGFVLTGREIPAEAWTLDRPPAFLETSMPGVFAAGDIRHTSVKRVAAAVGEGSTATLLVREYLHTR